MDWMRPNGRWIHSPLILMVAAGAIACRRGEAARESGGRGRDPGQRTLAVAVEPVARHDLARTVTVAAPVEPLRTIGVNSQASGTVLAVLAQEGDRVRAGQVLARLDAREAAAQLARARAQLVTATAAWQRDSALHAGRVISDAEADRSRSAFAVTQSDVALWETRVAFTTITAPSSGVVTAKLVEAGSAVSPNQRLFDLADVALLVARVRLSELDVVHLAPGAAVAVKLDAYPDARLEGVVRRVFPSADPQSRLVPVEVALARAPADVTVKPGYLARVEFALDRRSGVLAVPASAVAVAASGAFVYTVQADTLVVKPVRLGVTAEGWVEVTGGLVEGDRVVVSGQTNLRPGARVVVSGAPVETRPAP